MLKNTYKHSGKNGNKFRLVVALCEEKETQAEREQYTRGPTECIVSFFQAEGGYRVFIILFFFNAL